ncbi:MAG TPA: EscU/YscU/HrcU family type III secretion system export apparatus switch protein [Candidatus Omnitrophota bacterium]|nr:EscU/YscU/HrcU family type III secretion system export apparatus switch protein [Candidatus Omnitrophota bacterium]
MAEGKIDISPAEENPEKKALPTRKAAIAMRYDVDKDKAPVILATGRGPIADEIIRLAEDNKIPLYEDKELAGLLSKIELDTEVPPELYVLVAEVLFFVFQLDRMAEKREKLITRMREDEKEKKR